MTSDKNVAQKTGSSNSIWRFAPLAIVLVALAAGYALGLNRYLSLGYLAETRNALQAFVEQNYVFSIFSFAAIYVVLCSVAFPVTSILTITGGFLFGLVVGGAVSVIAATIGATVLFLAARSAFGNFLRKRVSGVAKRLADGFKENAFSYLLVLRLAPVFPFVVVNIAPALFEVKLRTFVAATFLGILPGVFAYSYLGRGVDSVLRAAAEAGREPALSDLVTKEITFAFAALAIVAAIPTVVRKLRGGKSST